MNAAPDGYTLLLGSTGTHAYNQTIYKKRRYDAVTDFAPVTLWSGQPMVLEARKELAANTIPEFSALLKANSTKMQYGSAGAGSTTHLACSLLNSEIGVNVTHVPYRGSAPAANDLISGQIDYLCGNLGAAAPAHHGQAGQGHRGAVERTLAADAGSQKRARAGAEGFGVTTWTAFFLPKGTPPAIVAKLNEVTHATMDTPRVKQRMLESGVTGVSPDRRSPEYLAKFVAEEVARWEGPIKSRWASGRLIF